MSAAEKKGPEGGPAREPPAPVARLSTYAKNTWCPGCGNFAVLNAIKPVFQQLIASGTRPEDIVLVSDIGCNSKIMDYIGVNSFDSLHGRSIPTAVGVKLAIRTSPSSCTPATERRSPRGSSTCCSPPSATSTSR